MCKCDDVRRIWNKEEKTGADVKALTLLVTEQFERDSEYYDEDGVRVYVLKCKDCERLSHVPHI